MDNAVVARAAEIKVLFTYASWRGEMMARGVGQLLTLWLKIREACNNAGKCTDSCAELPCGNANLQIVCGSRIITSLFRCDRTDLKHQRRGKREKTKRKNRLKKKQAGPEKNLRNQGCKSRERKLALRPERIVVDCEGEEWKSLER
jgi:hypothetical protein